MLINMKPAFAKQMKIYIGVIILQIGFAGYAIVAKVALKKGSNHFIFSVYRNAIAAIFFAPFAFVLEREIRPKMTLRILFHIFLLGLLDPVIDQNLFLAGMTYTTPTFTAAMCNILPAVTFLIAWVLRVESVNLKRLHSQAKILGTMVTLSGAMVMTLIKGPEIGLSWTKHNHTKSSSIGDHPSRVKGALMIGASNIGYSLFYIFQATVLRSYPAGLSLMTLICAFGALQGAVLTLVVERGNTAIWYIGWDEKLLAYGYGGIVASGVTYYISGVLMKEKGPVFVTSFNPLSMVIIAIFSSFIFLEQLDVGKITGSIVIIVGLYLVIWGKKRDQSELSAGSESVHQPNIPTNPSKSDVKLQGSELSPTILGDNGV